MLLPTTFDNPDARTLAYFATEACRDEVLGVIATMYAEARVRRSEGV